MSIKSKAAVCHGVNAAMTIEEIDVAMPRDGEVLVELKATGLCHSDLHGMDGSWDFAAGFPGLYGHEGAGIVREVGGGVTGLKPGDHVVTFAPDCGVCSFCKSGNTNLCEASFGDFLNSSPYSLQGTKLFPFMALGTFTQFGNFREIALVKVRNDAPFDQVCYFSCGATTGIGAAIHTAKVTTGSTVIVFGLGGIGLNVVQGARLAGAGRIVAVDTNPAKEAIARTMGATDFVNPAAISGDVAGHINELTQGGGDFTFEAVGNVKLMRLAFDCTRLGWGTCTVIGIAPDTDVIEIPPTLLIQGRRLIGSPMGGMRGSQIPALVDRLVEGDIDLSSLLTSRLALEEINEGYAMMKRGEGVRSVVLF